MSRYTLRYVTVADTDGCFLGDDMNELLDQAESMHQKGARVLAIADSIGPTLSAAQIIERLEARRGLRR